MSKKAAKGDLVKVDWIDSVGSGGWRDEPMTDPRCVSVGHHLGKKNGLLRIAMNKSAYGYGDYMSIPAVAVRKVTLLRKAPKPLK
jgi:hypothetical protein